MSADRYHGLLVIDKPAGLTSHDVVGRVRRLLGQRSVGHAGTLDPAATGVLPVAVGDATRALEYLVDASKTYLAEITLGLETDSHDLDGRLVREQDASAVSRDEVEMVIRRFVGDSLQIPPMHAAIKIGGKRLYELAHRGEFVERPPRPITIHELHLVDWQPPAFSICVHCSKGTYIRSLARDIGSELGVGAVLSNLVRLGVGSLTLDDAWTLDALADLPIDALWETIALHPDAPAAELPAAILEPDRRAAWLNGQRINLSGPLAQETVRVYDGEGVWLGIGRIDPATQSLQPVKVMASAA